MSCGDWEERIALRAGGDLGQEEAAAVDHHLAECAQCRETAAAYGWGLDLLRETHGEPIPEAHFAAVRARVLAELGRERRPVWRRPWAWALAAAVAAVLVAWVAVPVRQPTPRIATARQAASVIAPIVSEPPAAGTPAAKPARVARVRRSPVNRQPETRSTEEALLVKLYTDDPNVIIYWIAD